MRRVLSAPADLCMLVHRKRVVASENDESHAAVVGADQQTKKRRARVVVVRAIKRGDAIDEVVGAWSKDAGIHDSTEMMLLDTFARWMFAVPVDVERAVMELLVRVCVSFVTHRMMEMAVTAAHHILG